MKLYGRSDVLSLGGMLPDGSKLRVKIEREEAPGYGDEKRTVPFIETDDPILIEWLKKDGWQPRADADSLRTVDEIAFEERAARQGSVQANLMAQKFGEVLARMAQQNSETKSE
jgi:hypothetical protein